MSLPRSLPPAASTTMLRRLYSIFPLRSYLSGSVSLAPSNVTMPPSSSPLQYVVSVPMAIVPAMLPPATWASMAIGISASMYFPLQS